MEDTTPFVTAHLMGGLGNQLFQVAAAFAFAKEHKLRLVFSEKCDQNQTRKISYENTVLRKLERMSFNGVPFIVFKELEHWYQPLPPPPYGNNFYLYGYFQSWKYFHEYKEELTEFFAPSEDVKELVDAMNIPHDAISVHVRRGDYVQLQNVHYVQPVSYYEKALERYHSKDRVFYIFSDDIEWCKEQAVFAKLENKVFVTQADDISFYMMIRCGYHVISNSSFSWWAAYLSKAYEVVMPHRWFGPGGPRWKDGDHQPSLMWTVIWEYKVCIKGWYHPKNLAFLKKAFELLHWQETSFEDADIVFSGSEFLPIENYPDKRFIFGPHFSVFPDEVVRRFNNRNENAFYLQPSQWCEDIWKKELGFKALPLRVFSFGVDTERFVPSDIPRTEVFVYFKMRKDFELQTVKSFLDTKGVSYKVFDYQAKYKEEDYLATLQKAKFGIWLGCHESQGFALEEALSCNVPLLVWNVSKMGQENGYEHRYAGIKTRATSIPYWSEKCGEFFYLSEELPTIYEKFVANLESYNPRVWIETNLSISVRANALKNL